MFHLYLRRMLAATALTVLCAFSLTAAAQDFPTRPVTLIVPFPAGGPSDALARAVALRMAKDLGQPMVIENIAGASGTIGLSKMARSASDGYTLGFGTIGTHVANVALFKKLPYDPVADFDPIGMAGSAALILVAKSGLPASTLSEFIAYAQANKDKMFYGSAGVGSISHYGCVMMLSALKLNIAHVPYRGVAPAMNDLMGGQVDFMCDQTTTALPQVAGGRIKALGVLSREPLKQLPGVATLASLGHSDVDVRSWNAIFAPKGLPKAVLARLNKSLATAVADPELRTQMAAVGVELPAAETVSPGVVSDFIALGLRRDVPALKARGEYID
jgi:tripartite-type tricarboxylate transporter receptor subunit TctC